MDNLSKLAEDELLTNDDVDRIREAVSDGDCIVVDSKDKEIAQKIFDAIYNDYDSEIESINNLDLSCELDEVVRKLLKGNKLLIIHSDKKRDMYAKVQRLACKMLKPAEYKIVNTRVYNDIIIRDKVKSGDRIVISTTSRKWYWYKRLLEMRGLCVNFIYSR